MSQSSLLFTLLHETVPKEYEQNLKDADSTTIEYLDNMLQDDSVTFSDFSASLTPFLIDSGCAKEETEAQKICNIIAKKAHVAQDTKELPNKLDSPICIEPNTSPKNVVYVIPDQSQWIVDNTVKLEDPSKEFIEATKSENAQERKQALRNLCPCRVLNDVKEFWDRIIEMAKDPDASVRYQALHNLCDGAPQAREEDVIPALEILHNDTDKYIRRRAHQVLAHYRKTVVSIMDITYLYTILSIINILYHLNGVSSKMLMMIKVITISVKEYSVVE